jgi:hypothetical protein
VFLTIVGGGGSFEEEATSDRGCSSKSGFVRFTLPRRSSLGRVALASLSGFSAKSFFAISSISGSVNSMLPRECVPPPISLLDEAIGCSPPSDPLYLEFGSGGGFETVCDIITPTER